MDLEKYAAYSLDDYLEDDAFRHWVFQSDEQGNALWHAVFDRFPEQYTVAQQAQLILQGMSDHFQPTSLAEKPVDEAFARQLEKRMKAARQQHSTLHRRKTIRRQLSIAASILLLIGLVSWVWFNNSGNQLDSARTAYGQWKTLYLPDGSKVQLNANSEIKYAKNWKAGADREVWLQGEAFFEVTKDPQGASFTVFSGGIAIEVLGTAFNVHSRGEETQVFLQEGKVRLDLGEEEKYMTPGDFLAYSAKDGTVTDFKQAPEESHTSWKDGSLIMTDRPVEETFKKIEEIFGYQVVPVNPELLKEERTVAIPMDEINEAILILESIFQTEITLEEDRLIIH